MGFCWGILVGWMMISRSADKESIDLVNDFAETGLGSGNRHCICNQCRLNVM
uniref:Uncharacterized protein n=1 Tax=Helianthus annuus TaxID=4232 RepID=A0A251S4Q3_HELAN